MLEYNEIILIRIIMYLTMIQLIRVNRRIKRFFILVSHDFGYVIINDDSNVSKLLNM